MEREVRYCPAADGSRIAYSVEGDGPPVVCTPFFLESFALDHYVAMAQQFFQALARDHQLIRFDWGGTGLSSHDPPPGKLRFCVDQLAAVAENADLSTFAVWAPGAGIMPVLIYAAENPGRITRIAVYGGFIAREHAYPREMVAGMVQMTRANWNLVAQTIADLNGRKDFPDEAARMGDWFADSMTPENAALALDGGLDWDATEAAAHVKVPVLIMHNIRAVGPAFSAAQKFAEHTPNSRLVPLSGPPAPFFAGDHERVLQMLKEFFAEDGSKAQAQRSAPAEPSAAVRTVLFTDLVGHTAMMSRLGDERGRAVLREHEAITRDVLKQHAGTEIKTMGDGFMASFASVTKAVECAIALQRAFAERNTNLPSPAHGRGTSAAGGLGEGEPLNVRVGLNAGEPIEEEGDLFGATVILASRIAARAGGGEILVADTVRGLCSGKGFLFADRGEFTAKGFDDPVRIYEVNWRS